MDTVREGESRINIKRSDNIYVLSCVTWIAGEKLLCDTGSPIWCSVMGWGGMGWGKGTVALEGKDVYVITADLNCMVETNTTL